MTLQQHAGLAIVALAAAILPAKVVSEALVDGLIDPSTQPMFEEMLPNPLHPDYMYDPDLFDNDYHITVVGCASDSHETGLVDKNGKRLTTSIYGYEGPDGMCLWPGKTFEVGSREKVFVTWENRIPVGSHVLTSLSGDSVVDTFLHWAYSLPGYEGYTIENDGVPMVPHIHGSHTVSKADGNPEAFFSPDFAIKGPIWKSKVYPYENTQPAGCLWYHDHALGITRLNVHAGMAGFYIVRDEYDTGKPDNPVGLPAFPYEIALAIQDRMFKADGSLFYPSFPGEPFYEDFIDGEGAELPEDLFPNGGPTALAEFFGDIMAVNGKIWPCKHVEPRNYRLRILNGCDSRHLVLRFFQVDAGATDFTTAGEPLSFYSIGNDQGLASSAKSMDTLLVSPGARGDVVVSFEGLENSRVIMKNIGPDEPFGGDIEDVPKEGPGFFETDRIMAFDVVKSLYDGVEDLFDSSLIAFGTDMESPSRTRKLALFEGLDEYGRLQPLLGTAEPATDLNGDPIYWPDTEPYQAAGLAGLQMEGTMGWHSPVTENPKLGATEEWEIWNLSADAHPIHIHLVFVEVIGRNEVVWDSATNEEDRVLDSEGGSAKPNGDGTYLAPQPIVQHNGALGEGFKVVSPIMGSEVDTPSEYFEDGRNDQVVALPGQVTRIKATFDRPGDYVWHCHILAHEDHEMMRFVYVGGQPEEDGPDLLYDRECTEESPCGLCKGDCDYDSDCEGDLVCFQRTDYETVPGCIGEGVNGKDYCYPGKELTYVKECDGVYLCGLCEGDCDSDTDCIEGLSCFQRYGSESVPGCSGFGVDTKDYCYKP